MTTPEQLAKWREDAVKKSMQWYAELDGHMPLNVTGIYQAGYLLRCQETEQIMKLAKFGAEVLNEAISFNAIDMTDVCMFASELNLLKDDGKVTDAADTIIERLLK